jgi:5-methylcytosine-specific restriction endonuclease McrA
MKACPKVKAIRLKGKAMEALRMECFKRDKGICQKCKTPTPWSYGHMAHIISHGAGGSDVIDNVKWKCPHCHIILEHTKSIK